MTITTTNSDLDAVEAILDRLDTELPKTKAALAEVVMTPSTSPSQPWPLALAAAAGAVVGGLLTLALS